jgi:hypothetical protein
MRKAGFFCISSWIQVESPQYTMLQESTSHQNLKINLKKASKTDMASLKSISSSWEILPPKKNLQGVIEAFIEYAYMTENPTPLVIADFDRQQLEKFLKTTDNTSLSNLIHVLGYVDNKDLPSIYQMADLFP